MTALVPRFRTKSLFDTSIMDDFFKPTFNTFFECNCKTDDDGNAVLEIEVPGFNKDNINVEVGENILSISGETETRKLFKRYSIGDVEDINAHIQDGILTITLIEAKAKEPVKISITS